MFFLEIRNTGVNGGSASFHFSKGHSWTIDSKTYAHVSGACSLFSHLSSSSNHSFFKVFMDAHEQCEVMDTFF